MLRSAVKLAKYHPKIFNRTVRAFSSAKAESEPVATEVEKQKTKPELDFSKFNLQPRTIQKAEALPPVVKEFFIGEINEGYFPFLEVIEKEHVDKFFNNREFNAKYFKEITQGDQGLRNLRDRGNFGYDVPQVYNGNGFSTTEMALNSEIETENLKFNTLLNNHRLVTQAISNFGSTEQKEKYLRRLASGELVGTVAIFEMKPNPDRPFNTFVSPDRDCYLLNGEKNFVLNPNESNLFLVLANTIQGSHELHKNKGISAFLVEDNLPGIVRGVAHKTIGFNDIEQATLTFTDTPLTDEHVIGELNGAEPIVRYLLRVGRLQSAVTATQLAKKILTDFSKHCIESETFGGHPKDWELMQVRLGRMMTKVYAAESMVYFTASLDDAYENQDTELEAATSKLFALELLLELATLPFHSIGPKATLSNEPSVENLRNAVQIFSQGETIDTLKLFVALSGIEYSATSFADLVMKKRNPMQHPDGFFQTMFARNPFNSLKITKNFVHFLHPSLDNAAQVLELSLKRFKIATEISLSRHAKEILDSQTEVLRLARCATLLYSALAAVSRASRSYCIGIQYADMELLMANTYSIECYKEIKNITEDIEVGQNVTNDLNHRNISKQLFDSKGFFATHPLYRMF